MSKSTVETMQRTLPRRYAAERRFRLYGLLAVLGALVFLVLLFFTIFSAGLPAFKQTFVNLDIHYDPALIAPEGVVSEQALWEADFDGIIKQSLRGSFPEVTGRKAKRRLYSLVSPGAPFQLRDLVQENPELVGTAGSVWLPADDDVDVYIKSDRKIGAGRLSEQQQQWIRELEESGRIEQRFNMTFFTAGDSRDPEMSGIRSALTGSFFTLLVTLLLSFPIGVAAAVYLEEFAPQTRLSDLIEVNVNNLAAVPSIVFGLLGLAIFINVFGLPRSAPVVGGMVLTLMTLPTIIISSRAALKAVPPSIREAALGVGASRVQMVFHHVLPLAMPGMLTGTIIGMAQALGETAPLLMIGMVAFIVDIPGSPLDPSTVLPVQIYLWADSPERAFVERTSAAIMILLVFLVVMNGLAVYLRKRFERQW